ncbi:hypothetical protein J2X57_003926 [Luteibacter sp. 1214]|nr:hypothetical protein [Luteibacter sp. 1214]
MVTLEATPSATPQGRAATAAVYQWPSAGSGFAWGFSSRLSLPPRKRPVIPDRPRLRGLVQSKPSPAATGLEGHPRRLFGVPRWVGGRAGCGFFASLAFRAQGALLQAACIPPLRSPCGRSEPCSRTLSQAKANEAMHPRQASGPNQRSKPALDPTQPQSPKEPAGATLASGSRRRGLRLEEARRGPVRDDRPFSGRQGQPTRKPPVGARPGRRPLIHGRGSGLSLWGRRRRGREGGTRRLSNAPPHAATKPNAKATAEPSKTPPAAQKKPERMAEHTPPFAPTLCLPARLVTSWA